MNCSSCGHENRDGAKFCEACGTAFPRSCASCGTELGPQARFCSECGTPVAAGAGAAPPAPEPAPQETPAPTAPAPSEGVRKIVTILFADLAGSTALHERLDPESARRFMESYYDAARDAVESQGGVVTQLLGDGVKAVFGVPRVAEDDAIRAVRAGVHMQEKFQALAERQRAAIGETGLRVALNTGEVVAKGESEIIGDPVNVAARLQEQGRKGDVVVGESTARLVESQVTLTPLGTFSLKGRAEQVGAYRVESLEPPASAATAAFVGRDEEIARILSVYGKAIEKPAAGLAVLLGSPGLGKSRLIDEFARRLEDSARFVHAHCREASTSTFAPLALALREALAIEAGASDEVARAGVEAAIPEQDGDRARIASGIAALLAGTPGALEETFFVVRRLFAALASERPLVLVIDDLQWAEPVLLDLVEHLVEWGSDAPMLVLVGARPELREKRERLTNPGGLVADVVTLSGLDAHAAMRLAASVIGAEELPAAVAARVLATSEGNPLFVGELVRMLVHEGALTREGDRWTTGKALAALEMPPTIHALLAARIERLRPEERSVLERAAVVGRHFSRSAVAALLPDEGTDLDACLDALARGELIERSTGWFFGEPLLRFYHVLIRDAAYRQLLKGARAELHTRFADWAVERAADSTEHDETIGWHLEQAHQFLRELGPLDAQGREIGERAAQRLAAAGRRALAGDDVPLAASLLGRAIERLDADDDARADLALDWCEALLAAGDVGDAAGAIEELHRFVGDSDRLGAWHTCFAGQHTILTAPERLQQTVEQVAGAATTLAAQGDDAGEAKAHYVHALALSRLGQVGACEASLDLALAAARRVTGDRRRANTVLAIAPLAALWGPSAVTRASGRCLDVVRVLRITQGAPAVEAVALSCQGVLEALRGRTDAARRMIASARDMVEELGITQRLRELDVFAGLVDLYEGEFVAAERSLRIAYDGLRELGLGVDAARAAALLARALLGQDRIDQAEALSHESEALAGDDLKAAIAWRGVRAEALARSGEHTGAVELASKAVEIAAATDALLDHADARLALAAALRAAGRDREAEAEQRRANELWQAKGATLLAEHAQPQAEPVATLGPVAVQTNSRRRVRENSATAALRRLEATVAARDFRAARALFRDDHVTHERPTGSSFGPDDAVASLERLFRGREPYFEMRPLATLGDSLVLARRRWGAESATSRHYDVGAYENQVLHVQQVDGRGLQDHAEVFDDDDLNEAVVWLYERHAATLPEGAERERVATIARSIATMVGPPDLEAYERAWSPAITLIDRRIIGHEGVHGVDAMREWARAWLELEDFSIRVEEVLCLEPSAALVATSTRGTARTGGGAYERLLLSLWTFGTDGRYARLEFFDGENEDEALARFRELTLSPQRREPFENAATRATDRFVAAFNAGDWEGVEACFPPGFKQIDRRDMMQMDLDRAENLASLRFGFDMANARLSVELLATRGSRLQLSRVLQQLSDDEVGPSEIEYLGLADVNEHGGIETYLRWNVDDLEAAYAELEARWRAGEAQEHPHVAGWVDELVGCIAARDWTAMARLTSEEQVSHNHRLVGWGRRAGVQAWVEPFRAMVELSPDVQFRLDHLRTAANGFFAQYTWLGTREGGAFETPLLVVNTLGDDVRMRRAEVWDVERYDEAAARFVGLAAPAFTFANRATRLAEENIAAWIEGDWDRFMQGSTPDFHLSDRRRASRIELDREDTLAFLRSLADPSSSRNVDSEVLATRGESLALLRMHVQVAGGDVGPSEIVHLNLFEIDEQGQFSYYLRWDDEDLDAAYAELEARFGAGEASKHERAANAYLADFRAHADHDWDAFGVAFSSRAELHDRRVRGMGTHHGRDAIVDSQKVWVELSPDSRMRIDHLRLVDNGFLASGVTLGSRDGGAYELPHLRVAEVDSDGKIARMDLFDHEQLDAARARFAKLSAPAPAANAAARAAQDQLDAALAELDARFAAMDADARIPQRNAASIWLDRFAELYNARDWDTLQERFHPEVVYEDRQHLSLISGGLDTTLSSLRERADQGARLERHELLGVFGSRVAAHHTSWGGGASDGRFEMEFLIVQEVDDRGKLIATINFDVNDRRGAQREAWARWAANEPEAAPVVRLIEEMREAFVTKDRARWRAAHTDDLVVVDHRHAGLGRIEDPEIYTDSITAFWDMVDEAKAELEWQWPAFEPHGLIGVARRSGTLREGGGDYEAESLNLYLLDNGRVKHVEFFEVDDLDHALTRFEELQPTADELTTPPPNAASGAIVDRWLSRYERCGRTGDWEPLRAMLHPDMVIEDRQRRSMVSGGREQHVSSMRERATSGQKGDVTLLATAGEHLAMLCVLWSGGPADGRFEIEHLAVVEVDTSGRFTFMCLFDPEERRPASATLLERYIASGAGGMPAGAIDLLTGWNAHDLERVRRGLCDDLVLEDHRHTGLGRLEGADAYIAATAAMYELAPDVWQAPLYYARITAHGTVGVMRRSGTNTEGGAFETHYAMLMLRRGDKLSRFEFFEPEQLDRAIARLEELKPDPLRPPPT